VIEKGSHPDGTTVRVRVSPGAKKDRVLGEHDGALKVAVRAPAEKGRANREVCRLVAGAVGLAPRDVVILRGETARDKVLLLRGLAPELVVLDPS
jgi:uncharacterized protein (TIGR00251 family)